jgi:hypothetical protein
MALNPSGAISLAGPSAGQSIAVELGQSATATISLNDTNVRTLAGVASGVIVMPTDFWGKSSITVVPTQKALFGFGSQAQIPTAVPSTLIGYFDSTGTFTGNTSGVGTGGAKAAAGYGVDKGIFVSGTISNLVSNTGVVASNTPLVGVTSRTAGTAVGYGSDTAIWAYGSSGPVLASTSNLISNTGVVASDTPLVGTARNQSAAARYGVGNAIFGFGFSPSPAPSQLSMTNLVSTSGVIATDTPGVGIARQSLGAAGYGGDKAIFGYGGYVNPNRSSITNLVSNTGVVASDTPGVGTARINPGAAGYGGDKAIFAFGQSNPGNPLGWRAEFNQVSNTGVVINELSTAPSNRRSSAAGIGYSTTP